MRILAAVLVAGVIGSSWAGAGNGPVEERILREVAAAEYHFRSGADDDSWSAPNRAAGLRSRVSSHGIAIRPRVDGDDFALDLRAAAWGRGDDLVPVGSGSVSVDEGSLRIHRDGLVEWLVNDERGLEHGFDIPSPPPDGEGALLVRLEVEGLAVYPAGERALVMRDAQGRDRLRYRNLLVVDATGRELPARFELGPQRVDIAVEDRHAVYPVTIDPLIESAAWTYDGNLANGLLGRSVFTAGDVNGDGYSDILVAAPYSTVASVPVAGRVYLFLGSAAGPQSAPAWSYAGGAFIGELGASVSTAGDVNGDGLDDVIIGEPGFTNGQSEEGRALVFHGRAASPPLAASPDWTVEGGQDYAWLGRGVGYAGDVNGDGYADVIVGAPGFDDEQPEEGRILVYRGSASGLATTPAFVGESNSTGSSFGTVVSTAGDINGDGLDDVLVGAPDYTLTASAAGRMWIYHGTTTSMAFAGILNGSGQEGSRFASSVSTAGDVNGDGYADVIVGEPGHDAGQSYVGRAVVVLGASDGLTGQAFQTWVGTDGGGELGQSVSTAGDVNGDGYADVAIAEPGWSGGQVGEGRVRIFLGSPTGVSVPWATIESDVEGADLGSSVATAGDVDGDGFSDLVIGAQGYTNGQTSEGRAYWFASRGDGLDNGSGGVQAGAGGARLGFALAGGDFNGDGFSDLLVGAPYFDAGGVDNGTALIYLGGETGLAASPAWQTNGGDGDEHGFAVASAGDIDGDGYEDVLVGEPGHAFDTGRSRGYLGGPSGPDTTADWTAAGGTHALARAGEAVAGLGDVDGDGYADVATGIPGHSNTAFEAGRVWVAFGTAAGVTSDGVFLDATTADARFGQAVAAAGDVDRDGFDDLLVGAPGTSSVAPDAGAAYLYHGGGAGIETSPAWTRESSQAGGRYGSAVAGIGDFDRDGYSDFAVSAPLGEEAALVDEGLVYLYRGTATAPAFVNYIKGNQSDARIGGALSSAGDVNNDGYSDLAIGTPHIGTLTVWHGSPSWTLAAPALSDSSVFDYGAAIAHGDWNGDGFGDLAVGTPGYTDTVGLEQEGAVWFFHGNAGRVGPPVTPRQAFADFAEPVALRGLAGDEDEFGVIGRGFSPAGTTRIRLEIEARRTALDFTGTPTRISNFAWTSPAEPSTEFAIVVDGLAPSSPHVWRMRVGRANPLFPRSPWFSLPGNGLTETDIRLRCTATTWWYDMDGDGYGEPGPDQIVACDAPAGYVDNDLDCEGEDPLINPAAARVDCDGLDNDCSGAPDAPDTDGDGVDVCETTDANNPDGVGADCDPGNPDAWSRPSGTTLLMTHSGGVAGVSTLSWSLPADTGGVLRGYDVLRTDGPDQFDSADCLEPRGTDLTAQESSGIGTLGFYLVVPVNDCGGAPGTDSAGNERLVGTCP